MPFIKAAQTKACPNRGQHRSLKPVRGCLQNGKAFRDMMLKLGHKAHKENGNKTNCPGFIFPAGAPHLPSKLASLIHFWQRSYIVYDARASGFVFLPCAYLGLIFPIQGLSLIHI